MTLNANALNGSSSFGLRLITISLSFGSKPLIAPISRGDGKKSLTASNSLCTPLFLNAEPQSVGMNVLSIQPFLIAALSSFSVISSSDKYFSSKCSTKKSRKRSSKISST